MKTESTYIIADINSPNINGKIGGHYIPVAKMYKNLLKDCGRVCIAGGAVYGNYFETADFIKLPYSVNGTSLLSKFHNLINCKVLFEKAKGKTVILQQSRDVLSHIGIALFKKKKSKLYVIRYSNKSINNPIKRLFFFFCKGKIDGIICPSDRLGKEYGIPYVAVPDYIYLGNPNKANTINFFDKKYDFSIVGRIAPGKGAEIAAKKFAGTKYKVLIAGKPENDQIRNDLQEICSSVSNIDLRLGYVSDEDYERFHNESKYTILNYQGEYSVRSSGAVFDTLFAGVPVVGCRCESLQFVADSKTGYIYDDIGLFNPESVLDCGLYEQYQENIAKYRETHKWYKEKLVSFIKEK